MSKINENDDTEYTDDENIFFICEEEIDESQNNRINETNIYEILNNSNYISDSNIENYIISKLTSDYTNNYTLKQLFIICDYYGITKQLKSYKCNKPQIIKYLIQYETNPDNKEFVNKRKTMWFYINELKTDSCMRKYILW
jgi:hypothetical protein